MARRFDVSRRRDELTFQHHAEGVCALADREQDNRLELASAHGWSRNQLRRHLRASRAASADRPEGGEMRLPCDRERAQRWREAAQRSGARLEQWAIHALDDAALAVLGAP